MSTGWSVFVVVISVLNVLGCAWLIWWTARATPDEVAEGEVKNHIWDGNLQERNNSMPMWWLILFFLTIGFAGIYWTLYPGLGNFAGILGWTEHKQWSQEVELADDKYRPMYAAFAGQSIEALARDPKALALGHSLFESTCTNCHGSDARGASGFPNLTDNDWLHGGTPDDIVQSIGKGREGVMPALGAALGPQGVDEVVAYVLSLSGRTEPADKVEAGKARFAICAACHGEDGKGNQTIGAPNLTDDIWLYGGTEQAVRQTIVNGRHGVMPAHAWLGEDKVRLLAAYVYSLSHGGDATPTSSP